MPSTGDWGILDDICSRLKALGIFDGVYRSASPDDRGQPASDKLSATVAPASWDQTDRSDDEIAVSSERRVTWTLALMVREDDPETRERALDQLLAHCQNALDGQSLGGVTIPGWTRLLRGTYQKPNSPEQRMTVTGEFRYWIPGFDGNQTDDD